MKAKWFSMFSIVLMLVMAIVPAAGAAPLAQGGDLDPTFKADNDNPSFSLGDEQKALKLKGIESKMNGKTDGPVAEVAHGQFVELERQGEDSIWTVLGEFGNLESPIGILQGGAQGPQHNQMPEPDRSVDNTTIWAPDFSRDYYMDLLFSEAPGAVSMRNFYIEQSSNRYTVNGDVTDWGQVPYRAAHYGRDWCGGIVCGQTTWWFVRDSVNAWYNAQLSSMTAAEIDAYLSQFDVWDRYDQDGDGNFDEPDGYIDHFQSVHAGAGQETGGGSYGTDAIWSHRWYVQLTPIGSGGPTVDGNVVPLGGVRVGNSSYWIGDYTIEPENGGVGVFAHEFAHDLGLPDLYDTSGNTGGAENSTGFWTLMSSGSYGNTGVPAEGIGSKPIPMSAYEKIFLGWSNYEVYNYNQKASTKLGPSNFNTKQAQQLVILLPDKQVDFPVGAPYAGSYQYFSGSGNDLDNSMTRDVTLPAGVVTFSAKVKFDIEADWDFAFLTINGASVLTNLSGSGNESGLNPDGHGISGLTSGSWVDLTADLSAFAGQTVTLGFRYATDAAVAEAGFFIDEINVTGLPADGGETDLGWAYNGFARVTDVASQSFFNAYFAEFRTYKGYDDGLRTGPYNFGFGDTMPDWAERYPYQDGLLVWYYDESFADNNVGDHCLSGRCGGLYLPVDAHPNLLIRPDNGLVWRPRVQSYDSTFGLQRTDRICLHTSSTVVQCYGNLPANKKFDDTQSYWVAPNPAIGNFGWASVPLPGVGVTIRVVSVSAQGNFMQVHINK